MSTCYDEEPPALSHLDDPVFPDAACKGHGDLFDDWADNPESREKDAHREARHHQARNLCWACPHQLECFAWRAADTTLSAGIYGGYLFGDSPAQKRLNRSAHRRIVAQACKHCGVLFPVNNSRNRRVYCGDDCIRAALAQLATAANAVKRDLTKRTHCQECGTKLPPGQLRNCSTRCRKRGSDRRRARHSRTEAA